jgi:hypothetical protein
MERSRRDSQFRKRRSILLFRSQGKEEFVGNEPANKRNRKAIDTTVGTNDCKRKIFNHIQ